MQSVSNPRSATDALKRLSDDGYTGNFIAEPSGKIRLDRNTVVPADQVQADALYRFEGRTNPEDQSVVVAATYKDGDKTLRGALMLSYGPAGSAEDAEVLRCLQEDDA